MPYNLDETVFITYDMLEQRRLRVFFGKTNMSVEFFIKNPAGRLI
jgi:hypothetical protein